LKAVWGFPKYGNIYGDLPKSVFKPFMGYQSLEISKYGFCLSIGPPAARHRCASGCTGSPTAPEKLEVSLEEPLENPRKTVGKRLENCFFYWIKT
jgi:hypothetical protein